MLRLMVKFQNLFQNMLSDVFYVYQKELYALDVYSYRY